MPNAYSHATGDVNKWKFKLWHVGGTKIEKRKMKKKKTTFAALCAAYRFYFSSMNVLRTSFIASMQMAINVEDKK